MAKVSLVGVSSAGGIISGPGASSWTINGKKISLKGDAVAGHGEGAHAGPVMANGSSWMTIDGIQVVVQGCVATCGHTADGDSWMDIPL